MEMKTTVILVLITAVVGCFAKQADHLTEKADVVQVQELKPPSELALMMRSMAAHADSVKARIARNADLPPNPKKFRGLLTATPTEGMHIDPITFPTFGKDYLSKLGNLYKVKKGERTKAYNALVQSCANCHGTHCPGPLMRIKKMYAGSVE
ncbi:MAG: hypothetical protein IPH05_13425 [Flavobacteriales bacterium]|jgi:hypothetical protein|nr:hypothetical protein [Flavobacteriales bacterium]MBK6549499.1 hypothetical protein [Flavobacteriales bacterium]MBK6883914.1 hypothetical protein [Flavobacteriales bacterium]MBK7100305.1 hypothetical protein [Flavobacteriales bacterium]MBK7110999.1 hypothetical protein [Flavobacteriales bacterium]